MMRKLIALIAALSLCVSCALAGPNGQELYINGSIGTAGQLIGTYTNDNARPGNIGETIEATLLVGSAISLTSSTAVDVVSITLTPGDWLVMGNVMYTAAASTSFTRYGVSISQTSATFDSTTGGARIDNTQGAYVPGANNFIAGIPIGPIRISVAVSTIVYLVGSATFTVSTSTVYGHMIAVRIR